MKKLFKQPVALVLVVSSLWQSCYNPSDWHGSFSSAPEGQTPPEALDEPNAEVTVTWHGGSSSVPEQRQSIPFKVSISEGKYADKNKKRHYEGEDINSNLSNKGRSYEDEGKSLDIQEDKQAPAPLIEPFDITGTNNQSYRVYPFVTPTQAKNIESSTGIVLKTEKDKISGFLGGGTFGRVYVAEQPGTHQFYAVKIIQGNTKQLMQNAHEATIHQQLMQGGFDPSTSHFMPLVDAIQVYEGEKLTKLYYILPLAALGSVETLREQLKTLDNEELKRLLTWHIANGLLLGLRQMHKRQIYHLDMKPANSLINAQGMVFVSDFGTSEYIGSERPWLEPKQGEYGRWIGDGDEDYFPPERTHEGPGFDCSQADIYAAGASLWELVTGEKFPGDIQTAFTHTAFKNVAPNSLADLVKHLLVEDAQARWSLDQALNHLIFRKPDIHDRETMAVVLDFLKRFVQQVQLQARGAQVKYSLKELASVQATADTSVLDNKLRTIQHPFDNRPDIQEQLRMYLPLQGSFLREVKEPEKDCFDLLKKTGEFIIGDKAVLVLLADGGSGKSLFTQHVVMKLLNGRNNNNDPKPWLPLYIALGGIQHPENLLQEGLGLSHDELKALERNYKLLLFADGYDEQSHWTNLYVQNQLHRYNMKVIITSRINALPPHYSPYFIPQVPGEPIARGYQEMYVQPFDAQQIDAYASNYVAHHKGQLQVKVSEKRLGKEWLEVETYQSQINNTPGLKELIRTPLLCRLSLEALPELAKSQNNNSKQSFSKVTRAQLYEAFMTRWIGQQQSRQAKPPTLEQVFTLGQRTALSLYQDNRSPQVNYGIATFQFKPESGYYQQQANALDWFIQAKAERDCLPIQEVQKGQCKLMHFSMQEFLLARHLYQQLKQGSSLKDLDWNQLKLTTEEKDRPILYFLADFVEADTAFKDRLFALVEQTKADKSQARAASNAITVLNAAHVSLCSKEFAGIAIPDADLSGGVLWGTNFKGADLTNVNSKMANLFEVDLQKAQLSEVRLGQLPSLKLDHVVDCCIYSPDGRYLAIAAGAYVILYDAATHKKLYTLGGHSKGVIGISYSPDGNQLASGSYDGTVKLWDVTTGKCIRTLLGHSNSVNSVSYSPNGNQVASGSYDKTVRLWDVHTGGCVRILTGHSNGVNVISYSPDGDQLASGSEDTTVRLWDVHTGRCVQTLMGHSEAVNSVSYRPGGILASVDIGAEVHLWDLNTGNCIQTRALNKRAGWINCTSYSPDGRQLASGDSRGNVKLWDPDTGNCVQTLAGHSYEVFGVNYSPDGNYLASVGGEEAVKLWDLRTGSCIRKMEGHSYPIDSISLNEKQLASGDDHGWVKLWDLHTGRCLQTLKGDLEHLALTGVLNVNLNYRSGGSQLVSVNQDYSMNLLDKDTGMYPEKMTYGGIYSISYSPDRRQLASISNNSVKLLDIRSGACMQTLTGHSGSVSSVSYRPDGSKLASGGSDKTVKLWRVHTGRCIRTLEGHSGWVNSVSYNSVGNQLASGSSDKTIKLWDEVTGKCIHTLKGHSGEVNSVSYSSDSIQLASGSNDNTVKFWEVSTGKCIQTLTMPQPVRYVAWIDDHGAEKLVVSFEKWVAVFRLKRADKELEAHSEWMSTGEQILDFTKANVRGVQGLTSKQWTLMQQLGAVQKREEAIEEKPRLEESKKEKEEGEEKKVPKLGEWEEDDDEKWEEEDPTLKEWEEYDDVPTLKNKGNGKQMWKKKK